MTTPTLREAARAICRVQYNGGDPDQPAVRWNGTEMEPQEFPAWEDFLDEARAVIAALAQPDEDSLELRAADERSSYLATELNEANSRIERLEAALEAWVDTDKFMVFTEAGERQFALARRLTEEARK